MGRILIIDDDQNLSAMLSAMIRRMGHAAQPAYTLQEGLNAASLDSYDVIFLDVGMPDGNGLDKIPILKQCPSSPEIIIMTGTGNPDGAETAIEKGAWDYIEKPSSVAAMSLPLIRALQYREAKTSKNIINLHVPGIIGSSPQMKICLNQISEASASEANVLLLGETGTGKELFAEAIHRNSLRADNSFVVVDCAALSPTLVESQLFGYEKGTFTGADRAREGLILQADGGTLFLDEIGELPFAIQKSFLRVLHEKRFRPIGSKSEAASNFRLITATNRNLEEMVQAGTFRTDLLFRIRSLSINIPPLRNRVNDIQDIALFHLERVCGYYRIKMKEFSPEYLSVLMRYDWPGNIRELINAMESSVATARDEQVLFPKHLPNHIRIRIAQSGFMKTDGNDNPTALKQHLTLPKLCELRKKVVSQAEKEYLSKLMRATSEDIVYACRIAGVSRSRLYELLRKHKIKL